ncbi:electron transfer flavoprotein subunit beta/FixA family protein [Sphaerochaeta halotolerans]|jgi:electron transfer flavoprotein beta subunit|uniref:electron transfer flavoprotein subunit beta/FixA family protein n=1 Tax=Sphaerochaeta halotolerans TaxID=2293840 RepID=UPI00136B30D1|nr:electron transfer flavoprotein subunit beta/FixA family protein [Sphaerochaeta halotolerans]MXI87479.1 electron transfer flavoprotein subunit beta [Sphaerochaeta halotolerans]
MHSIVLIKQVPQTSDVQMDKETGTMIRSGSTSILNPLDVYALETALQIKDRNGGRVTVITMGPASAVKVLKEAIAMGCDDVYHLNDRAFAGSDTWATSYVLAKAIEKIGIPDLVITGERATDGDTAQVGPAVASWLDLPVLTYVASIENLTSDSLIVERLIEEGYQRVQSPLPALLTVVKEIAEPRLPTLRGKKRAMATNIVTWSASDLDADPAFMGLRGSPTRVVKIATPKVSRQCRMVKVEDDDSLIEAVDQLFTFLEERDLLGGLNA